MADAVRSADYFLNASTGALKDNSSGAITEQVVRDLLLSAYRPQMHNGFRLTTESGVPVSTSDRTSQSTLYLTPAAHGLVGLYDGTSWTLHSSSQISLSLSGLTSGKAYDVFVYNNSGTLTLALSAAWADANTPTDAVALQDGVPVLGSDHTRRHVGTIYTTGTTTTEDSKLKRFVWNLYNQAPRVVERYEIDTSHGYSTGTWREWNGGTGGPHRLGFVTGNPQALQASGWAEIRGDGSAYAYCSLSLNDAASEGKAAVNSSLAAYNRFPLSGSYLSLTGFNELIVNEIATGSANFNYYLAAAVVTG